MIERRLGLAAKITLGLCEHQAITRSVAPPARLTRPFPGGHRRDRTAVLRLSRLVEAVPEIVDLDLNLIFVLPPVRGCTMRTLVVVTWNKPKMGCNAFIRTIDRDFNIPKCGRDLSIEELRVYPTCMNKGITILNQLFNRIEQ